MGVRMRGALFHVLSKILSASRSVIHVSNERARMNDGAGNGRYVMHMGFMRGTQPTFSNCSIVFRNVFRRCGWLVFVLRCGIVVVFQLSSAITPLSREISKWA